MLHCALVALVLSALCDRSFSAPAVTPAAPFVVLAPGIFYPGPTSDEFDHEDCEFNNRSFAGLQRAAFEINALGGIQGRAVDVRRFNWSSKDTPTPAAFAAKAAELLTTPNLIAIAHNAYDLTPGLVAEAAARKVSHLSPTSIHGVSWSDAATFTVNMRPRLQEEAAQLVQYALNSVHRCKSSIVATYNVADMRIGGDAIAEKIAALGLPAPPVLHLLPPVETSVTPKILEAAAKMAVPPKCYFLIVPSYWSQRIVEKVMENEKLSAADPIFLSTSISTRFSWRHSVTGAHDVYRNVYASGTFPHPLDTRFTLVQKFRQTSIAAKAAGALDSMTPDDDTKSPQSLEGYITGRFIYEALTRVPAGTPITGSSVADTAFKTKLFDIDDVTVGPFIRSCVGHRTAAAKTCWCNTGGRSVFMTKVSGETGHSEPVVDNATMFEHEAAPGVIPLGECAFPPTFPLPSKNVVLVFNDAMAAAEPQLAGAASAVISAASSTIFDARVNGELTTFQVHPARVTMTSTAATIQRDIEAIIEDRYETLLLIGSMLPLATQTVPTKRGEYPHTNAAPNQTRSRPVQETHPAERQWNSNSGLLTAAPPTTADSHIIAHAVAPDTVQHHQHSMATTAMQSTVPLKLSVPTVAAVSSLEWLERDPNTMPFDKFDPNAIPFWPTLSDFAHTAAAFIADIESKPLLSSTVSSDIDAPSSHVLPSVRTAESPWNATTHVHNMSSSFSTAASVEAENSEADKTTRVRSPEAVHIIADTPSLADLATRSVETHLERSPNSVSILPTTASSELPSPFGHAAPTSGSLILITQRRDILASINERCAAAGPQLKVFLATSEFLLDLYRPSVADEATGAFRNSTGAWVPIPENLFFLSGIPGYFNGTRAATLYGEALGAFAVRVAITAGVARGKPVETEAMVASLYSSGSVLAGRVTIQPLSMTPCTHTIPAEGVFPHPTTGRCQCNKGLNTFHVIRAANASRTVFSYSHDFCGVAFRALPAPANNDSSLSSTAVLAIACGVVIVIGIVCALVAALLTAWTRYRRTRFCPTDPTKPFAAFFVTVRNEAALRERHPMAVEAILQSISETAIRTAAAHRCHVAQRLDAHCLIVAADPSDAMQCACAIVQTVEHVSWAHIITEKNEAAAKLSRGSDGASSLACCGSSHSNSDHGPHMGRKYRSASRATAATVTTISAPGTGRRDQPSGLRGQPSTTLSALKSSLGSAPSTDDVPSMSVRSVASSSRSQADDITTGSPHSAPSPSMARARNRSPAPDLAKLSSTVSAADNTGTPTTATQQQWSATPKMRRGRRGQTVITPLVSVGLTFGFGTITRDDMEQSYRYRGDVVDAAAVIADVARPGQLLATEAAVDSAKGAQFGDAEEYCARQLSVLGTDPQAPPSASIKNKHDPTRNDQRQRDLSRNLKQAKSNSTRPASTAVTLMQVTPIGCAAREFAAPTSDDGAGNGDAAAGTLAAALETAAGCLTTRRIAVICVSVPALRNATSFKSRSDHAAQCEATYRAVMSVAKRGSHDVLAAMDGQLCVAVNARAAQTAQVATTAVSVAHAAVAEIEGVTGLRARAGVAIGPATVGLCDDTVVTVGIVGERARLLAAIAEAHDADPSVVTAAEMTQELEAHFEICAIEIIAWPRQCQRSRATVPSPRAEVARIVPVQAVDLTSTRNDKINVSSSDQLSVIFTADTEIAVADDDEEEWLYQLEHVSAKNPHSDRNAAFAALLTQQPLLLSKTSPPPPLGLSPTGSIEFDSARPSATGTGFAAGRQERTSALPLVPSMPSSSESSGAPRLSSPVPPQAASPLTLTCAAFPGTVDTGPCGDSRDCVLVGGPRTDAVFEGSAPATAMAAAEISAPVLSGVTSRGPHQQSAHAGDDAPFVRDPSNALRSAADERLRVLTETVRTSASMEHQRRMLARSAELRVASLCFSFSFAREESK